MKTRKRFQSNLTTCFRNARRSMVWAMFCLALCVLGLGVSATAREPFTITFDPPGSVLTEPLSINPAGAITGVYFDSSYTGHGFLRAPDGGISPFDPPGSLYTQPYSINPAGAITGYYCDAITCHGFLRDPHGTITPFDVPFPDAVYTQANCIDPEGAITGNWNDSSNEVHGFLRDPHGRFTNIDVPGAATGAGLGTHGVGINPAGWIAGWYTAYADGAARGYLRTPDGKTTTFAAPDAGTGVGPGGAEGTYELWAAGFGSSVINPAGAITGWYADSSGALHGFLRTHQGRITEFDVGPAGVGLNIFGNLAPYGTVPSTINPEGAITGYYLDANFVNHGFLLDPQGRITEFDVQGAGTGQYQGTVPSSNNPAGAITGLWVDPSNVYHGFLRTMEHAEDGER